MKKLKLTISRLCQEASEFASYESAHREPSLFGVTDGKAIGTYLEQKFRAHLQAKYAFSAGNSASGIDFPRLGVDVKVTAVTQPQSSCPFKSARQKIFGLGYSLLVFVYEKADDPRSRSAVLKILHTIYIDRKRTADYSLTRLIRQHLAAQCNAEDLVALMRDKNLPVDEIEAHSIAEELLRSSCEEGFLTISNALQWRLQYGRAIERAGTTPGIRKLR